MRHPTLVKGYRERLLKVITSSDVYTIMREIGQPPTQSALDCRYYLLENWNDDIRDRVMAIVTLNIEPETK